MASSRGRGERARRKQARTEGRLAEMEGKQKVALTFALYQNEALVRRETVTQDIVKVGKDPRSHLRVDDELASRMHAVIEVASPSDITLIDLGNEPGTMVNGQRVNKCKVRPGDQIQIGSTMIHLESAELAGAQAAAPAPTAGGTAQMPAQASQPPPPVPPAPPTPQMGLPSTQATTLGGHAAPPP